MTKNFDERIIDKGFHTGYEVDYVTIPEHDYEYLKYKVRLADDYETINKELHQRGRKIRKQNKRYREELEELRAMAIDNIDTEQEISPYLLRDICEEILEESEWVRNGW